MPMWDLPLRYAAPPFGIEKPPRPRKDNIVETLDAGQMIKTRIDACREESAGGSRLPLFQVTATEV
jgi:hypothetical protein